jgi:hypothetical protein
MQPAQPQGPDGALCLEERFVTEIPTGKQAGGRAEYREQAGAWSQRWSVMKNYRGSAWCQVRIQAG